MINVSRYLQKRRIDMKKYWKRSLYYWELGPRFFLKYLQGYRLYLIWEKKLYRIDGYFKDFQQCMCTNIETSWRQIAYVTSKPNVQHEKFIVIDKQEFVFRKKEEEKQLLHQTMEKGWQF
ncbi:hypothetical protein JI528_14595 [Listeria monocytogenes]|nr:hypothetical protein [Listeria monocytogenes]MCH5071793.1 hypothetical protein [Listeria monocytogenes]